MANYYDYVTGRGVIVPDTSTVLGDVQDEFKALFGGDLDVTPETIQGRLIEMITRSRVFTIQACAAVSNMLNLNKANGFVLDDLGSLFLLSRQPATYTEVSVVLTGVSGTIVPEGTRLKTTGGEIFVNTADYTIGSPLNATFRAQEKGVVACLANTLTIILDAVSGLETANNPANGVLGRDLESDAEFRSRIKTSLNVNSIAVISAIKANLEQIPGVVGTYLYDNYSTSQVVVDDITVPAHSILAIVDGGDSKEIANVLYSKKTIGAGYLSGTTDQDIEIVTETVLDPIYGTSYTVKFARPKSVSVVVNITVERQNYTGADLESAVKNAILTWAAGENDGVEGLKIGTDISPFEISAAVSNTLPEIFIRDCEIGKQGGSAPEAAILTLDVAEKGVITASNITVTVI